MGFGTVVANIIMIIMTIMVLSILVFVFTRFFTSLDTSVAEATEQLKQTIGFNLVITGAVYNSSSNDLYINITNKGPRSIVFGLGYEVLIDYINTLGERRIELQEFGEWIIYSVYIENQTTLINATTSIEFIPGATVEINLSPSTLIMPDSSVIIVLISPEGCTSEYIARVIG